MSQMNKRIMKLEKSKYSGHPYVAMVWGNTEAPMIPDDIGDREVMVMRMVFVTAPVRDAAGNILNPNEDVDDNDPCYDSCRNAMIARRKAA